MSQLDLKRIAHSFGTCVPLFQWDEDLAEIAQAWADQCALVEYTSSSSHAQPKRLHHDQKSDRERLSEEKPTFVKEPGIAQSVHWSRTPNSGFASSVAAALIESELQIEDGLIDGLFTNFGSGGSGENVIAWGHATHIGCGWIQFPGNETLGETYENFMVCNYAIGKIGKTSCSNGDEANAVEGGGNETISYITYYPASSQVIDDMKACLSAVRCSRRRQIDFGDYNTLPGGDGDAMASGSGGGGDKCNQRNEH
jgi:hypothetical protein